MPRTYGGDNKAHRMDDKEAIELRPESQGNLGYAEAFEVNGNQTKYIIDILDRIYQPKKEMLCFNSVRFYVV